MGAEDARAAPLNPEVASTLREAIHDDARAVRELARFALTKREGFTALDFVSLYKRRLAASTGSTPGRAEGLAEVATANDLDVLRRLVEHENGRIRAAGWVGIGRADPAPQISDVETALCDRSRVVRSAVLPHARRLMRKGVTLRRPR